MRPSKPPNNRCPQADREACPLTCKYNHFESDDLTIDAWELKCTDCGLREAIGYRSDEADDDDPAPTRCPFCSLEGLCPGKSPCDQPAAKK